MGHSRGAVWILNDSIGLQPAAVEVARVVGLPIHLKRLSAPAIIRYLPDFVQLRLPPNQILRDVTAVTAFSDWPILIIAAGGKSAPIALALKRLAPYRMFALKVQMRREWTPRFDLELQQNLEERRLLSFDAVYNVSPRDCRYADLSDRAISDANLVGALIKRALGLEP